MRIPGIAKKAREIKMCRTQAIVVNNITKKKRSYTIVSDENSFEYCVPEIIFGVNKKFKKLAVK